VFKEIYAAYREVFGINNVFPYLAYIPTYPTGMWSFSFCSKGTHHPLKDLRAGDADEFVINQELNYYSKEIHRSAFVLPRFVKNLLDDKV
jgi:spermidine synthase